MVQLATPSYSQHFLKDNSRPVETPYHARYFQTHPRRCPRAKQDQQTSSNASGTTQPCLLVSVEHISSHMDNDCGYAYCTLLPRCHPEAPSSPPRPPQMAPGLQDVPLSGPSGLIKDDSCHSRPLGLRSEPHLE